MTQAYKVIFLYSGIDTQVFHKRIRQNEIKEIPRFILTLQEQIDIINTMRTNLPKTLDQLIFSKCTQNQLNISKFLPPKRCKTLRSY